MSFGRWLSSRIMTAGTATRSFPVGFRLCRIGCRYSSVAGVTESAPSRNFCVSKRRLQILAASRSGRLTVPQTGRRAPVSGHRRCRDHHNLWKRNARQRSMDGPVSPGAQQLRAMQLDARSIQPTGVDLRRPTGDLDFTYFSSMAGRNIPPTIASIFWRPVLPGSAKVTLGHVDYLASLFYRGGGHMPRLFRTEPLPATTAKDARSTRSEKGLEGRPRRLRSPKLTTLRRTPKACSAFSL